jgi:biotin carboxyl carrier protein
MDNAREEFLEEDESMLLKSPMSGTVMKIYCTPGQKVKLNDPLISVGSMNKEFLIRATHMVKVKEIKANES